MSDLTNTPQCHESGEFSFYLGWFAILANVAFAASILIADQFVPNHDWVADTISDLGAGKYEFIVDIGIYAFSASILALALVASHVHMGGKRWTAAIIGLAALSLIVFLVGARNEYGDNDNEGVVIHVYLVYAIGVLFAAVPICMAPGIGRLHAGAAKLLYGLAALWIVAAPVFFFLPDSVDGLYERGLGGIAMAILLTLCVVFIKRGARIR